MPIDPSYYGAREPGSNHDLVRGKQCQKNRECALDAGHSGDCAKKLPEEISKVQDIANLLTDDPDVFLKQ